MKKLIFLILFLFPLVFVPQVFAKGNSFVSIVNPVRGNDFWDLKNQKPETAVLGQIAIMEKLNTVATWLIRFDVLENENVINALKGALSDEKGLFLEVTPAWTDQAKVEYRKSGNWHAAGSAFLTGYERLEREQLIDAAFTEFRTVFGYYPLSVGAWWVDSYSIGYMRKKYGITAVLIVADQYSTDNYQIWGQYFGTPYYPSKGNALHPAQSLENKLDVVITQWALRDPVNSYGNGVWESTFSVQANDYIDYHNLDTEYFLSLIDVYTKQEFNRFSQLVVGLENSYEWEKYSNEYQKQIEVLTDKRDANEFSLITLRDFSNWYKSNFPKLSPEQLIIADDPLGSFKKTVWFMNPYFRAGLFINSEGAAFRDIRQYVEGEEELCFKTRCDRIDFATSATRVLDDVSFGHKWVLDQGKINDFKAGKRGEEYIISYKNEAGNLRQIGFMPRDIRVDEKISSIDAAILNAVKKETGIVKNTVTYDSFLKWSFVSVASKISKFLIFLIFAVALPGLVITYRTSKKNNSFFFDIFLSITAGLVALTLLFYISGLLKLRILIFIYILINFILFARLKIYKYLFLTIPKIKNLSGLIPVLIILAGTVFQVIPTFKSGLNLGFGLGFWGPNTHDGVWHMALVNQLTGSVPPENPVYSGMVLKNYHFFYDLLIAVTNYFSAIPAADLIFRFYPVVFSLMLGVGSYYLIMKLFESNVGIKRAQIISFFSLYMVYFAGSFGWIVEYLRERHFGGESAFWVNQAISFNLNPPFALSLIIIIAFLHIIFNLSRSRKDAFLAILLAGSLIGFKSYGAVLILASVLIVGLLLKQISLIAVFVGAAVISVWIFLSNFNASSNLLVFAPFWFVHSMIDSPDRVGWVRITLMRETGLTTNNWFKLISAELLSLIIFIAGNLGLRVVSLISLVKVKSIVKDRRFLLIFVFSLLSFLIPTLFIQSGNPWNTIQFSYYGIYIAALVSGVVLSKVFILPKVILVPVIFMLLIFAPINSVVTAGGYLANRPHAFIPAKELEGLQFLSTQTDGAVLTYPYNGQLKQRLPEPWPILAYDSTAYVSAVSQKSIYLEDEPQNQILLTDYKKRVISSRDFFLKPVREGAKFLQDNGIKYIYLPKIYNVALDENTGVIKNIFENEEVIIYKVN